MMIDLSVLPDDLPYVYQIYMTFTHISPSYLSYLPGDNQLNSTIFTRFYQMFFSYLHIFTRYLYGFLPSIEGPWSSFFRDKPRSERIRRPREVPLAISESPAVLVEVCRICGGCIHEWDINGIYK